MLVQTADEFLIHQWWLDPEGVGEVLVAMAEATSRPRLSVEQILESLGRFAPEFVNLVQRGLSPDDDSAA